MTALKGGRAKRKVSLALGGWNDSKGDKYSRLVNDPKARRYVLTKDLSFRGFRIVTELRPFVFYLWDKLKPKTKTKN